MVYCGPLSAVVIHGLPAKSANDQSNTMCICSEDIQSVDQQWMKGTVHDVFTRATTLELASDDGKLRMYHYIEVTIERLSFTTQRSRRKRCAADETVSAW
jgi:hypothetical protein